MNWRSLLFLTLALTCSNAFAQHPLARTFRLLTQQGTEQQTLERPFPELDQQHQDNINDLLEIWEKHSNEISNFGFEFQRWDYDTAYCDWRSPADNRLAAYSIARGNFRFAKPDKSMFETMQVWDFSGVGEEAKEPNYQLREDSSSREKWLWTRTQVYKFDFANKRLYEMQIPEEMQGLEFLGSPLPLYLLFGVEKDVLMERYWFRVITPDGVEDEYWLQAWPKRVNDAFAYQKLEIALARKDLVPKNLTIYAPNYDETKNPQRRAFEFGSRKDYSQQVNGVIRCHDHDRTPSGWKRIDRTPTASKLRPANRDQPSQK